MNKNFRFLFITIFVFFSLPTLSHLPSAAPSPLYAASGKQKLNQHERFVFNLSQASSGFGDVTGPLWTLIDIKKHFPHAIFTALYDEYARKILLDLYDKRSLPSIGEELQIAFISSTKQERLKKADYSFELFVGGRSLENFTHRPYNEENTLVVVGDTMHSLTLDEVILGDTYFYFSPPGIGPHRSGIVTNPELSIFHGLDNLSSRQITASMIPNPLIGRILKKEIHPHFTLGFIYGVHVEKMFPHLIGQTKNYLSALKRSFCPDVPLVILTPNSTQDLEKVIKERTEIPFHIIDSFAYSPRQLAFKDQDIYIISTGKVSNKIFTGLIASSETPVLVEGNSSVSTSLRLHHPFLMYQSTWNTPQIHDLISLEEMSLVKNVYRSIYSFDEDELPLVEKFFKPDVTGFASLQITSQDVEAMSNNTPKYGDKLVNIITAIKQANTLEALPLEPKDREDRLFDLMVEMAENSSDPILICSLIYNFYQKGKIENLGRFIEKLESLHIDFPQITTRFFPKAPKVSLHSLKKPTFEAIRRSLFT